MNVLVSQLCSPAWHEVWLWASALRTSLSVAAGAESWLGTVKIFSVNVVSKTGGRGAAKSQQASRRRRTRDLAAMTVSIQSPEITLPVGETSNAIPLSTAGRIPYWLTRRKTLSAILLSTPGYTGQPECLPTSPLLIDGQQYCQTACRTGARKTPSAFLLSTPGHSNKAACCHIASQTSARKTPSAFLLSTPGHSGNLNAYQHHLYSLTVSSKPACCQTASQTGARKTPSTVLQHQVF